MPLHRVIIFCARPEELAAFYAEAFGMAVLAREAGFVDLGARGSAAARLAFHKGKRQPGTAVKLCFHSGDIAADRERLIGLGARMGAISGTPDALCFCDGKDAEGNVFQISNRD
jgi:catechol 2,3-dioxygenase-like lactoylglutathione lyase family enzyme